MLQNVPGRFFSSLCMVSLGSLEALRQWLASAGSWMVSLGSQVVYGVSKTIVTNIIQMV